MCDVVVGVWVVGVIDQQLVEVVVDQDDQIFKCEKVLIDVVIDWQVKDWMKVVEGWQVGVSECEVIVGWEQCYYCQIVDYEDQQNYMGFVQFCFYGWQEWCVCIFLKC